MHEMSLAGGILRVVEQAGARERFSRVKHLRLEAGALAGVEARALRFALEAIAPGTFLEGAVVDIEEPAASAWCLGCDSSVSIRARGEACPRCGSYRLQATGGTELRVLEMIVHDDE